MQKIVKYIFAGLLLLLCVPAFSQQVEMADGMRASGKIYVIVTIVLIVLTGLITYLFLLDRKIGNIEKRLNDKK